MTTLDRLREWSVAGVLDASEYQSLAALVRKERVSVFVELSAAFYVGVLAFAAGLGWTCRTYFRDLGDPLVLATLSLLFAGSLYYCFRRVAPYSREEVESANIALDYVLYLGCLALSVEFAYLAFRFDWLRAYSDDGLLAMVSVFALLAFRFDNRFVLSLALASLAGWFGIRLTAFVLTSPDSLRIGAIVYGAVVASAGAALYHRGIKRHFLETFLHVAANATFAAVVSGVNDPSAGLLYFLGLLALSAAAIVLGIRFARFAFVAYGIVYGYAGISFVILPGFHSATSSFAYFVVTGAIVVVSLALLARQFGRAE
jgi:hypothetical protein